MHSDYCKNGNKKSWEFMCRVLKALHKSAMYISRPSALDVLWIYFKSCQRTCVSTKRNASAFLLCWKQLRAVPVITRRHGPAKSLSRGNAPTSWHRCLYQLLVSISHNDIGEYEHALMLLRNTDVQMHQQHLSGRISTRAKNNENVMVMSSRTPASALILGY